MKNILLSAALAAAVCAPADAGITITAKTTFGGGDGWRAPAEVLAGDSTGATYSYLGTGSFERGLAYNAGFDKLILLSRNGGVNIRQLDPQTGVDVGQVATGTGIISGGFFAASALACDSNGALYAANLTTGAAATAFKIYKWADIGDSAPSVYFNSTISGFSASARLGDSLDLFDNGGDPTIVAGCGSGVVGYVAITGSTPTATAVAGFSPTGPATGDFRLGITFAGAANAVWGRQTGGTTTAPTGKRTTFTEGNSTGTYEGVIPLVSGSQAPMDYAVVDGKALLAVLNISTSVVSIYDVTNPAAATLATALTVTSGSLTSNGNGTGSVKWGAISGSSASLYAMSTNQGIQAFNVSVTPDVIAPTVASSPGDRTVYERGQTTFSVTATGTAPFTYEWSKDGSPVSGAVTANYTINPVSAASAGSYVCRVTNSAGFAESTAAVLTVVPSVNTAGLTQCWSLSPGARPWITSGGDTERGIDYDPASNHVYIVSRNPSPQVYLVDGTTSADVHQMDVTGVSGGNFALMFPGVNADGSLYVCNLSNTTDGSSFKIYKWATGAPGVPPVTAYDGNPVSSRIGDSFDVRGSGAGTECVAGARNLNQFVIFKELTPGVLTPSTVTVADAPAGSFGLGVAFGEGNTVWGKGDGGSLYYCSYDAASGTGSVIASYGTAQGIPPGTNPLGVDPVNRCIAMIDTGNSDNVRLFSYSADPVPVLTLLDQEFFPTDNSNGNRVGSVYAGAGKVYALDTNNGALCLSTLKPAAPQLGAITPGAAGTFNVQLTGTPGFNYVIESSTDLVQWTPFATVPFNAPSQTVPLPNTASRTLYRARLGP